MVKIYPLFLIVVMISTFGYFFNHSVYAGPSVQVSPTCGPSSPGFNIYITGFGFTPNSPVNWKLIDSHSTIPMYGYFIANSEGGFNDMTFVDNLSEDNYKMAFATDANNDNKFDAGAPIVFADIVIPCSSGGSTLSPSSSQNTGFNWLEFCRNPIVDSAVSEPCETLTSPDGYTLTQEGKRVIACFLGAGILMLADKSGTALAEAKSLASQTGICG